MAFSWPLWGHFGPILDRLGPSGDCPVATLGHFGSFWPHLRPSWDHAGAILDRLGAFLAPRWPEGVILKQNRTDSGLSGAILGPYWAVMGPLGPQRGPWAVLDPSWPHTGPKGRYVGATLDRLGPFRAPSCSHPGAVIGPLGPPSWDNLMALLDRRISHWTNLGRQKPRIPQNHAKPLENK